MIIIIIPLYYRVYIKKCWLNKINIGVHNCDNQNHNRPKFSFKKYKHCIEYKKNIYIFYIVINDKY